MASTTLPLLQVSTVRVVNKTIMSKTRSPEPSLTMNRRQCLLLLTATSASIKALALPALAEDIGLFGIRKKIKKAEEEVEEVVKEGIQNAEKVLTGLENAEKGLENAEKGLEEVEKEVEAGLAFSGLVQAGAVVGAEVVGLLVATSIVNGILGPEGQKA